MKTLLEVLKVKHPAIKKVHYFSDGCAGQYKNRYNFINLCFHKEDFELLAEWNFFATSHGKTACDGIGGTAKHLTLKASLQRPVSNQILNPRDMFSFCNENIIGIQDCFLGNFVSKEAVLEAAASLQERFSNSDNSVICHGSGFSTIPCTVLCDQWPKRYEFINIKWYNKK